MAELFLSLTFIPSLSLSLSLAHFNHSTLSLLSFTLYLTPSLPSLPCPSLLSISLPLPPWLPSLPTVLLCTAQHSHLLITSIINLYISHIINWCMTKIITAEHYKVNYMFDQMNTKLSTDNFCFELLVCILPNVLGNKFMFWSTRTWWNVPDPNPGT